jgi:NADPH-dependent ferric siderophore reductase/pimeloyl-ACP methyl ester carboxylesterase
MPTTITSDGTELYYETIGSPANPPLLLVMGYGSQMIAWPRGFSEALAAGGRFVIEFDNRDSGLSSKLDGVEVDLGALVGAAEAGDTDAVAAIAPYTLSDLAGDCLAVLDALGIGSAHVLGASMGGMIAQQLAIEHPERVLTLISMMSNTGEPEYGQPTPEALAALLTPSPPERDAYIHANGEKTMLWASSRYGDQARNEALAAEGFDRCFYPDGVGRQLAAILATGSRAEGLRALRMPTLVIHGRDDTLIQPSGGERTAELVPGAKLLLVDDMGHDRPEPLWPLLTAAILEHTGAPPKARARNRPLQVGRVESIETLTPTLTRIVFGGEGLDGFEAGEFADNYVKLQFPREGAPADERPKVRTYTVREWDPAARLLTIDFVVHGDEGIAGPWAARTQVGDTLGLRGPGGAYNPDPEADWHLMVGDTSVIPAISASLARVPAGAPVHVVLQVHGPEEQVELTSAGGLEVHWLHGDEDEGVAAALAALDFPPGTPQVFLHGEATSVRLARRHLVVDRQIPATALAASGYWKRTLTDEGWREAKRDWNAQVESEDAARAPS